MPHILSGSTQLAQFGPLHFLSAGAAFGGFGRAGIVSGVGVGPGMVRVDTEALAAGVDVVVFSTLEGPDGGMTSGCTADIADDAKGGGMAGGIANCVLGRAGEVMGDEKTGGVPG